VRRLVTAAGPDGRSYLAADELLPAGPLDDSGGFRRIGLWLTATAPASNDGFDDPVPGGKLERVVPPGRGGTVVRIVDIPPEGAWHEVASLVTQPGVFTTDERTARHHGFHRTNTLDYAMCLEGEVWLLLDDAETLLRAGDVVIQRGTYHAWSNRSGTICRVLIVMVDAAEPETAAER
jgi:quercetin dioxygenase-like cupin family protein